MARCLKDKKDKLLIQNYIVKFTSMLLLGAIAGTSHASPSDISEPLLGVTTKISTLGVGGELSFQFSDNVEMIGGLNLYDYTHDFEENNINYDGTLYLNSWYTGLRYYPMNNGLYLGGGAGLNRNSIKLEAQADSEGNYNFNGNSYKAEDIGHVRAIGNFYDVAGFGLLGFETKSPSQKGLSFFGEVGVYIAGEPKFESDILCSKVGNKTCELVGNDFKKERMKIQESMKVLLTYPIVGFGTRLRF